MKRLEEKVKDIVEVRQFSQLSDFAADPARTLAGYHFTDITSDLMGKWIERIAGLNRGLGMAAALAGFRGVGKSHFLASVAAVLSRPELRTQVTDDHVRSTSDQLVRRPYLVAYVRRGSGMTLLEEFRSAVGAALGAGPNTIGTTVTEILHQASLHSLEQPFVIFFDTAAGREARVARDDGPLLSEIAEVGKSMGMFIGVALDDDISSADGTNAPIARSFVIDYLDQEHLFKIVDTHIFAKASNKRQLLSEIYANWRSVLPGFRWSEQRFFSLYPMHPATLEVAPLIRLYLQDFALLGFAAEAGMKILGRPANSLIGLDEMFDKVEARLRNVEALKEAFASFDQIDHSVIAKLPVTTRLTAKLILKGLFLLSLDGQGATPDEIAASMMIYSGGGVSADIGSVLTSFCQPGLASEHEGKFRIGEAQTSSSQELTRVEAAASEVSDEAVWTLLLRHASEKFSDLDSTTEFSQGPTVCTVEWRGALRRGEIIWRNEVTERLSNADWTIRVDRRGGAGMETGQPVLLWRVGALNEQDKATLRRCHVLRTDDDVREELGDTLATQVQISSIAAERIWQRVFLQEARLVADGREYEIYDESAGAHTLSQLLSKALSPYFERLYPEHPQFGASLGVREASQLIGNFFGGGAPESAETRRLVEAFAVPLGLGTSLDGATSPASVDQLAQHPLIRAGLGSDTPSAMSLKDISRRLSAPPLGLTREAQHILLSALVAQKQFDFVTLSGNRINHRSLDLQIIWDDIEGIAVPRQDDYPLERLVSWAKVVTGNETLASIDRGEDRRQIIDSLKHWLETWQADNALGRFDELPEEQLNTAVWKLAAGLKRTFGTSADSIRRMLEDEITLADCLKTIAEIFSDSEPEYERRTEDLAVLNKFVLVSGRRQEMLSYVGTAEWTGVREIDDLRRQLLSLLVGGGVCLNGKNDRIDELWSEYRKSYGEHFAARHAEVMSNIGDPEVLRTVLTSEMWSAFRSIAELQYIDQRFLREAEGVVRQIRTGGCNADAESELQERPVCSCGNGLAELTELEAAPAGLRRTIEHAVKTFRSTLLNRKQEVASSAAKLRPGSNIDLLLNSFEQANGFPRLTAAELILLRDSAGGVCEMPMHDEAQHAEPELELSIL